MSIRQRFQNINSYTQILSEGFEEESVEGFRQEVERLRALFYLIGEKECASIPEKLLALYRKVGVIRDLQLLRRELIGYARRKKVRVPESCIAVIDGLLATASRLVSLDFQLSSLDIREPASWPALHGADLAKLSKAFVGERMKAISVPVAWEDLADGQLRERQEALKELLYIWLFVDGKAVRLIRPAALANRQAIHSQVSLLSVYQDAVLRMDMLQDPNFLFATGQGAKPFLQAVLQDWLREKQELRAKINNELASEEARPVGRRRYARPVVRSMTECLVP